MDSLCSQLASIFAFDDVNTDEIELVLSTYKSNEVDWAKFAMFDKHKYTRNLVDVGNGKYNLMILCWGPGMGSSIHDHTDSHCFVKVLQGKLLETRYEWPNNEIAEQTNTADSMVETGRNLYDTDDVSYMNDDLGLHRMENPSHVEPTVSLHLYTPPYDHCQLFDQRTSQRQLCQVTFWSEFGKKIDMRERIEARRAGLK